MAPALDVPARNTLREAIRFWELNRIGYNLALAALCGAWVVLTWPHFRPGVVLPHLAELVALILLANVCYCAAYLAEALLQGIASDATRQRWRWGLWLVGTLFALFLAQYWIGDEIYPSVS